MATQKRILAQQREDRQRLVDAVDALSVQILAMSRKLDKMAQALGHMAGSER